MGLGLLSVFVLVWSLWTVYRLWTSYRRRQLTPGARLTRRERRGLIIAGLVILFSFVGRPMIVLVFGGSGADSPQHRSASAGRHLSAPDGTRLYVESAGPVDAPTLVLTHG